MNNVKKTPSSQNWLLLLFILFLTACGGTDPDLIQAASSKKPHGETVEIEPEKGPHHGRLLKDGDFTLELALFEIGVPPEFRVWTTKNGSAINPEQINLTIQLTRFGNKIDTIHFKPTNNVLRGDIVIYEPHSFAVNIDAIHNGTTHKWAFDSFEGRTKIKSDVADDLQIKTEIAGSVLLTQTISAYGQVTVNAERTRHLNARFDGVIKSVALSQGDKVRKGQKLATVESNESLQLFTITSPMSGVISQRDANVGEQTNGRQLFTIMDTRSVWIELSVFPADLEKVKIGAAVTLTDTSTGQTANGKVTRIDVLAQANQSVNVRVVLKNENVRWRPGRHISAKITVIEHAASLAVKRSALQTFRDFTVVYEQVGEEYEINILELGVKTNEWVEVLSGMKIGARYVSENSYVIKADIEKSGASHDH